MNTNNTNTNTSDFATIAEESVKNFTPVMTQGEKNLPREGNNSGAFMYLADEKPETELKNVLGMYSYNEMVIEHREMSVVIRPMTGKSKLTKLFDFVAARGALSAITALHRTNYIALEYGFHATESHAVLTANYAGNDSELLAVKPEKGMVVLEKDMGEWVVSQRKGARILRSNIPAWEKNEPNWVKEMRSRYWKHRAIDMIVNGETLLISPVFWKEQKVQDHEATAAYIAKFMASLELTSEEAQQAYEKVIVMAEARRHEKNIHNAISNGRLVVTDETAFWSMQVTVGDQSLTVQDLLGKQIFKYQGNVRLNNSPIVVHAQNVKDIVALTERGWRIELAQ